MTEVIKIYPVEASAGANNNFDVPNCSHFSYMPRYMICLNKLDSYKRFGHLRGLACEAPIKRGSCVAMAMRQEEIAAGKALYFIERKDGSDIKANPQPSLVKKSESGKRPPMVYPEYVRKEQAALLAANGGKSSEPPPPPRLQPKKSFLDMNHGSYADAINAAQAQGSPTVAPVATIAPVAMIATPTATPTIVETPVTSKGGMSLADLARSMLAAKNT